MIWNIKCKDTLNLNTFVIKYTKFGDILLIKDKKLIFKIRKIYKNKIISRLFKNNYLVLYTIDYFTNYKYLTS